MEENPILSQNQNHIPLTNIKEKAAQHPILKSILAPSDKLIWYIIKNECIINADENRNTVKKCNQKGT